MAISVGTPIKNLDLGQAWLVVFPVTLSGTYSAGGESLSGAFSGFNFKSPSVPFHITAEDVNGYSFRYIASTNKLMVYTSGANAQDPFAELSAGAYPGGLTTDVITGIGYFKKG